MVCVFASCGKKSTYIYTENKMHRACSFWSILQVVDTSCMEIEYDLVIVYISIPHTHRGTDNTHTTVDGLARVCHWIYSFKLLTMEI